LIGADRKCWPTVKTTRVTRFAQRIQIPVADPRHNDNRGPPSTLREIDGSRTPSWPDHIPVLGQDAAPLDNFAPVRTFGMCVERAAQIRNEVLLVLDGQYGIGGRVSATSRSSGGFCIGFYRNWLMIENSAMGSGQIDDTWR
jgi:hypothetical protein